MNEITLHILLVFAAAAIAFLLIRAANIGAASTHHEAAKKAQS